MTGFATWVRLKPDWRKLPSAFQAFDLVVAARVLDYVAAPAAALRERSCVLRPGGVLLYAMSALRNPSDEPNDFSTGPAW
jgi:ubiquinone/menaquinone biosynthesis C-methylase UbiE